MYRVFFVIIALLFVASANAEDCVSCHEKVTPGAVTDWKLSRHFTEEIGCDDCHGDGHSSATDLEKVLTVTAETCAGCHQERFDQYKAGKHALAWAALKSMPTTHFKPMELIDGQKGCGGCHKIGLKTEEEIKIMKANGSTFGHASCDSCHTRHTFFRCRGEGAGGMCELPYGLRPPAVGNVFNVQARYPSQSETGWHTASISIGTDLPGLPHE